MCIRDSTTGVNANLAAAGHITGTVKNAAGTGIQNVSVTVYSHSGSSGWEWADSDSTGAAGTYDVGGLGTGAHRVRFYDYSGDYLSEYYDDKATLADANDVAVTAGSSTEVNATLSAPATSPAR